MAILVRRSAWTFVAGVIYFLVGVVTLIFRFDFSEALHINRNVPLIFGISSLFAGAGALLVVYLRGDFTSESSYSYVGKGYATPSDVNNYPLSLDVERLTSQLDEVRKEVAISKKGRPTLKELSPEERESLLSTLKVELASVLASDVLKQIEEKYSSQIANDAQVAQIRKGMTETSTRLRTEIAALSRRANLNLVIGTLTTVAAVGLLTYLVLGAAINHNSIPDLLSHFIPRISIAVFIEVFSFFFLKLYKSSLQEIKYFQNELTNIEMRGVALETALLASPNKTTEPIVEQLMRTDRNPVSVSGIATDGKDVTHVEPKDIANLLDKLGKLLSIGSHKLVRA